ncbi:hypothetical protein [Spirosoma jeollabukense]
MGIILFPKPLHPDFFLYFFTFLSWITIGTLVFLAVRYLLGKGRGKRNVKSLAVIFLVGSIISSCQVEHESIDTKQQVEKLVTDFKLVKSDQVTTKNSVVFNSIGEAQNFLKALSSKINSRTKLLSMLLHMLQIFLSR